ncbi:MAG: ribose 5-phosphate isomerase B [bacterium]|nr:ribose 5-phosphate isomerase B [bacterium]MDD5353945.1 ribose 5-phosphate isomerase B [bacterium]MDD5756320.1 ribose 5-phosphate isomerase B [bacterium]
MIAIGSDHGGVELKEKIKDFLTQLGHEVKDLGTNTKDSVDYPDIALRVAEDISQGKAARGVLLCKTGIGMCIAANKVPRIRAALCCQADQARLASEHNQANVLCLSGLTSESDMEQMIKAWLETPFGRDRHMRRIDKITAIEKKYMKE